MGIVCSACKHLNGFGSLSCSNCGKRLFDEDGSESIPDTGGVRSEPRTLTSKGCGNRPLLIGLVVIGAVILVIVVAGIFHAVRSNGAEQLTENTTGETASITAPSPSLSFQSDQNDQDGYEGRQWGSTSTDGLYPSEEQWDPIVEKVIGPPGRVYNASFIPDTDSAPNVLVLQKDDDTQFGFYSGQLSWVSVRMQGAYADVERMLDAKYSESEDVSREFFGDGQSSPAMWEGFNFNGKLYRRGKTNTRIYLLSMADQDGNQMGLWMLYIPTSYVQQIRQSWWDAYQHAQQAKADKENERGNESREADREKIQ